MVVNDNHTAVSCFWAAMQTTSSKGAVGRVMRVMSVGRAVIALNRSLRAYQIKWSGVTHLGENRTHVGNARVFCPQVDYAPYSQQYAFS